MNAKSFAVSLGLDRRKTLILMSVLLVMFLSAVDVTIVETAMPTIIGAVGGAQLYTWVFTIYMLTMTVATPLFGKFADLFGRKAVLLSGVFLFVLGSALCGLSQSMIQLIIFRGIQGIGAGATMPSVMTVIGDMFTPAQRARMQGIFSTIWGGSALVGPLLGGIIVDGWNWRWIFYVNVPFGLLASIALIRFLDLPTPTERPRIDYAGAALLTIGTSALLLALSFIGTGAGWGEPLIVGLLSVAVVSLVLFVRSQKMAPEPILPLELFSNRLIALSNLVGFLIGAVMMGFNVYLPLFRQGVQGGTAIDAGLVLMPLAIGWPLASLVAAPVILRLGYRASAFTGTVLQVAAGALMLSTGLSLEVSPWLLRSAMFLIGAGMGFSTLALLLGVQSSVGYRLRGAATASVTFIRTLGQTVGLAAFGTIVNLQLLGRLRAIPGLVPEGATAREALNTINRLVDPVERQLISPDIIATLEGALAASLMPVFWLLVAVAAGAAMVTIFMPRVRPDEQTVETH